MESRLAPAVGFTYYVNTFFDGSFGPDSFYPIDSEVLLHDYAEHKTGSYSHTDFTDASGFVGFDTSWQTLDAGRSTSLQSTASEHLRYAPTSVQPDAGHVVLDGSGTLDLSEVTVGPPLGNQLDGPYYGKATATSAFNVTAAAGKASLIVSYNIPSLGPHVTAALSLQSDITYPWNYLYYQTVYQTLLTAGSGTLVVPLVQPKFANPISGTTFLFDLELYDDEHYDLSTIDSRMDFTLQVQLAPPQADAKLQTLSFNGAGRQPILSDPTVAEPTGVLFTAPQWQYLGANNSANHSFPVLYVVGGQITLDASFVLNRPVVGAQYLVKGDGPENFDFPQANAVANGGVLTISNDACTSPFANLVRYFKDFSIHWQVSVDGGATWTDAGTSDNTVYVAAATPATTAVYQTVVDIAVRNNDGTSASDRAALISHTWADFADLSTPVLKADGEVLHYYSPVDTRNTDLALLLRDDNGQCSTWAKLFLTALAVNGIAQDGDYREFLPPIGDNEFLVKNWAFPTIGHSPVAGYPYINLFQPGPGGPAGSIFSDVVDDLGVPGQASADPTSDFVNHQVAYIDGKYYDASYGAVYSSVAEWQDKNIDGFLKVIGVTRVDESVLGVDTNGDGRLSPIRAFVELVRRPLSTAEIQEEIWTLDRYGNVVPVLESIPPASANSVSVAQSSVAAGTAVQDNDSKSSNSVNTSAVENRIEIAEASHGNSGLVISSPTTAQAGSIAGNSSTGAGSPVVVSDIPDTDERNVSACQATLSSRAIAAAQEPVPVVDHLENQNANNPAILPRTHSSATVDQLVAGKVVSSTESNLPGDVRCAVVDHTVMMTSGIGIMDRAPHTYGQKVITIAHFTGKRRIAFEDQQRQQVWALMDNLIDSSGTAGSFTKARRNRSHQIHIQTVSIA